MSFNVWVSSYWAAWFDWQNACFAGFVTGFGYSNGYSEGYDDGFADGANL